MSNKIKYTDAQTLEKARVALANAETVPEIAGFMAKYGYDTAKFSVGKNILTGSQTAYQKSSAARKILLSASRSFIQTREQLNTLFLIHRQLLKLVLEENPELSERLKPNSEIPENYAGWCEELKEFYSELSANEKLQEELVTLNITPEVIEEVQSLYDLMEQKRTVYMMHKGYSQNATKAKDAAFVKLRRWMRAFYKIASIALKDQPQLQEALGVVVKD